MQAAYLVAHFIKWPEIQIDMNSGTRVNGLAAWAGPRRKQIGRHGKLTWGRGVMMNLLL